VYLIDTDVISESRKGVKANPGVRAFFREIISKDIGVYVSAVSIGEIRRGVENLRHRGDSAQANKLEKWFIGLRDEFGDCILPFDEEIAQIWGRLRVPNPENPIDKQIAATALIHDLTVVTRNTKHFAGTGVRLLNPFE
jgi:predicted nucleic acid-binding protein